jgi:hypothetical protein
MLGNYLSKVDIKHATSAVDQLTVTRLQRNGQIATLRRLQVAQFRYGTPVNRRLMTRNITAPTFPNSHRPADSSRNKEKKEQNSYRHGWGKLFRQKLRKTKREENVNVFKWARSWWRRFQIKKKDQNKTRSRRYRWDNVISCKKVDKKK